MKKLVFVCSLTIISTVSFATELFQTVTDFQRFYTYYYLNPQREKVIPSIDYYVESKLYERIKSRTPIAHFYASILRFDNEHLLDLIEWQSQAGTMNSRGFTIEILVIVNTDVSTGLVQKYRKSWSDEAVQERIAVIENASRDDIMARAPKSMEDLDNIWSIFFATGSEEAVEKVASILYLRKRGKGADIMLGEGAYWSLLSNAKQHGKVLKILKSEVKRAKGVGKRELEEVIRSASRN